MVAKNEFDPLIKKIGKLNKKIRFIAIIHKNGKILKSEMRDEVPSLLKTKNEEKFCQDVTARRKMRDRTSGGISVIAGFGCRFGKTRLPARLTPRATA